MCDFVPCDRILQRAYSGEDCEIYHDLCSTRPGLRRPHLTLDGQCFAFAGPHPNDTDFLSRDSNLFSLQLPVLPSVLGSRRGNSTASSDMIPEPLDFLVEGESQKKSQTDIGLDTTELVAEKVPEEVQTSLLVRATCVRRSVECLESLQYVSGLHFSWPIFESYVRHCVCFKCCYIVTWLKQSLKKSSREKRWILKKVSAGQLRIL